MQVLASQAAAAAVARHVRRRRCYSQRGVATAQVATACPSLTNSAPGGCFLSVLLRLPQGRPVYIQLLGKIDINTLKQITTEERMIKFHIQEYERCGKVIMPICSRLAGRQIDQTFGIMDVKGEVVC